MASVVNDSNGRKRILFVAPDGRRMTVRVGQASDEQAREFKVEIERLQTADKTGHLTPGTAAWLKSLDDVLYGRLARAGLVEPRQSMTLSGWLATYIDARKTELKPKSLRKLENTKAALLAHFKADPPLRSITPQQASEWRAGLEEKLSVASVKTYSGNAKTIMAEAVRRKIIPENPFAHLKSGSTSSRYRRYITPDEIARVIDACPNSEWRLLFGLARYAGLRIPSESHRLTVGDVDWERGRMTVHSPKTEHHDGHESRLVPIVPKLMDLLQARYDELAEGEDRLVRISGQGNMMRWIRKICAAAGVELWERFWQTLRSSCEQELAMTFPQYAVSRWIGHSITVSGKHYANSVPDELFDRAASAAHFAAQQEPETARKSPHVETRTPQETQETALDRKNLQESIGGGGNRTRVP